MKEIVEINNRDYILSNSFFNIRLKLSILNKIRYSLFFSFLKLNFFSKYRFINVSFRSLNSRFVKFYRFKKKKLSKFSYLFNFSKIISIFFFSNLFLNSYFILNFISNLFSCWYKNHYIIFKKLVNILLILLNLNILNVKGFFLEISGKVNGSRRKKKIRFNYGKFPFSKFKSKMSYSFISKLTVFGSIGMKLWLIFY